MNEKFESQKERLLSIKKEISLLYQQVNYLIRNEKPLELLDLDVLMNRTHTLYDQLCAINVGDESFDEDLPFDAEVISGLFGGMMQEESQNVEPEETDAPMEEKPVVQAAVAEPEEKPVMEVTNPQEKSEHFEVPEPFKMPSDGLGLVEEVTANEKEAPVMEIGEEPAIGEKVEVAEESSKVEEQILEDKPISDEYGLFFRFEDVPENEDQPIETPSAVETEGKVVHVMEEIPEEEIPERDRVHGDDLVHDNPLEMPQVEDEIFENGPFGEERPVSDGLSNVFEKDDTEFEFSVAETLGEKMMGNDHSLAAKLQQTPGRDLKSVIGINDKFLFVNELFGGSMEKYNKSIENLNDLKTLNGALIYLNELKIELQWNSSNEGYLKLKELVMRKFE